MIDDEDYLVIAYGGAQPDDIHLAANVHCIDGEIVEWLKRRERRRRDKQERRCHCR
jgi:hypothetical protein